MIDFQKLPGHPHVAYCGQTLYVEGVPLSTIAQHHGTPTFVYSKAAMLDALSAYERGLAGRDALICYAMKANSSLAVLQVFAQAGCGFDIVSGGELARVLRIGADPKKIVFSGVGKRRDEIRQALAVGIACFNVESLSELVVLNEEALAMGCVASISLRVNPDVDPQTHPYISTGLKDNKFGIAHRDALRAYALAASLKSLRVVGIDCHIGSQITTVSPYLDAMDKVLDLVAALEGQGIVLEHIDFGGGLGINYGSESPPLADVLWAQLLAKLDARGLGQRRLLIEPGRSLVGNAGVCLTRVEHLKVDTSLASQGEGTGEGEKNFCIVDAAMNDLPRPAMYQAFHGIVPCEQREQREPANAPSHPTITYDVVGPVCESGDWLGRSRKLAVETGDCLAVLSAGAYCMSMASNYNTRGRAAEVLVSGKEATLIRCRESFEDQISTEIF